ncbi:S-layer homology domain-containing protein [Intestinimonas butyriciproducens]|nr:S-layer homology domain-containing protein [Intestinimonas butyriciproducens]
MNYAYIDETIFPGETPALCVKYVGTLSPSTGFRNGETADSIEGFVAPTVQAPDVLEAGQTYTLQPSGGKAQNYQFTFTKGTLTVLPAEAIKVEKPTAVTGLKETGGVLTGVPAGDGYTITGNTAADAGTYTATATLIDANHYWSDGTQTPLEIQWTIGAASGSQGGTTPTTPTDKTQTVTANLYLPGESNQVLPGITVYLNNSNNPIQGTGTPTTPESDNAKLTTAADGTKTLTLSITNPVFTLQSIGSCSNARIIDTKTSSNLVYQGGATGKYSTRISEITVELLDDSGEYVFDSCTEFPTLLGVEWNYPLILAVNFDGGKDDSLDSNDNVDVSGVTGGNKPAVPEETPAAELNPTVTAGRDGVANVEFTNKDLDAALEQVQENGGAIVIQPEIEGEATRVNVDLPKSSVEAMAKSDADLVVKTEIAAVSIPSEGLAEIAKANGSTVTVSTEKANNAIAINIAVGGKTVEEIKGGITVAVSAEKKNGNVLVLVSADGTETVVKKSVVDGDTVKALLDGSATVKVVDHSKSFTDTTNHWAKDSIAFASSHELFQGVSATEFAPDQTMSRAMLATVLYRLEDAAQTGESVFTDVVEGAWYADGVAWANENGIVSGYGNGVFAPNDNITREQLVVMLYRYAQHLGMDTKTNKDLKSYSDADTVSSWATDAMKWAVDKGLIAGRTNSTLTPGGTATRAETATILQRMVELMVK